MGQVEEHPAAPARSARAEAARRLATTRRRFFLARTASGLLITALAWASGFSGALWAAVGGWLGDTLLARAGYAALLLLGFDLLALPFAWYGGYRVSCRFGLSRQTPLSWLADWAKATGLGTLFATLGIVGFYLTLSIADGVWWLPFGIAANLVIVLLTFVAPYVLVPIFYRMRPLRDESVVEAIRQLSRAARTEVREVCTLDFSRKTAEANAAVIGIGRSRRVVLADTLLSLFDLAEIRAVVAHELGHHVHRDVARLLAIQSGLLWAGLALGAGWGPGLLAAFGAGGGLAGPINLPLLLLGAELFGLATLPLANALSRHLEAAADEFALNLTQAPAAFASAMRKLAEQNLAELRPPRWAEILLYTHPPLEQRIRAAEARVHG